MKVKNFILQFFKNLAVTMTATLVSFTFVIFTLLNMLGDKASFQWGSIGQTIASVFLAWFVVSVISMPPLMAFSLGLSYLQLRKKK